jgi:hypothetical protein
LGFDGAEVLHVPPATAAGVLPEAIHQRREVNGVSGGPPVVVVVGVNRRPVGVYAPVGRIQGEEGGGPVASGIDLTDRAPFDRSARQVRCILTTPGGALDRLGWRIQWG